MSKSAENVVQNIGAIAETTSIFYNTIVKQVPKDVALILTQHFMDITIARRPVNPAQAAANQKALLEEMKKRQQASQQQAKPENRPEPEKPAGDDPAVEQ